MLLDFIHILAPLAAKIATQFIMGLLVGQLFGFHTKNEAISVMPLYPYLLFRLFVVNLNFIHKVGK